MVNAENTWLGQTLPHASCRGSQNRSWKPDMRVQARGPACARPIPSRLEARLSRDNRWTPERRRTRPPTSGGLAQLPGRGIANNARLWRRRRVPRLRRRTAMLPAAVPCEKTSRCSVPYSNHRANRPRERGPKTLRGERRGARCQASGVIGPVPQLAGSNEAIDREHNE